MAVERVAGSSSLIDVLDRILDKGIVVDAWVRISLVGIDVISEDARVVVAANNTCLSYDGSQVAEGFPAQTAPADGLAQHKSNHAGERAARRRR
jgi:hypothetical protein